MGNRNPSDEKRRAIEGILNPKIASGSPSVPDDYSTTGFGVTSEPRGERRNIGLAIFIATVIVIVGVAATLMIIFRDNLARLLALDSSESSAVVENDEEFPGDVQELREALAGSREELTRLRGLPEANANLKNSIEEKDREIKRLRSDLDLLKAQTSSNAQKETNKLVAKLTQERDKALRERDRAVEQSRTMEQQLLTRNQEFADNVSDKQGIITENNELRRTLLTKDDKIGDLEDKVDRMEREIEDINESYRRILKQLSDARTSITEKDQTIRDLRDENKVLRQQRMASMTQAGEGAETSQTTSVSVIKPNPTHRERPEYPASALRRKVGGVVQVRVLVGTNGKVVDAEIISSPDPLGSLDRAALKAARAWRFQPATRNGVPVQVWYEIPMEFKPRS